MSERTFMTAIEAAEYLGTTRACLYMKCSKKQIPYYKPSGGRLYFLRADLDKWIASGRVASQAEINQRANNFIQH